MRLSKLQKYILASCSDNSRKEKLKKDFYAFYSEDDLKNNFSSLQDVLQKSIDNLVAKDLLAAFGYKTARKWFIQKVKLTAIGQRVAKQLINSRQRRLPIK